MDRETTERNRQFNALRSLIALLLLLLRSWLILCCGRWDSNPLHNETPYIRRTSEPLASSSKPCRNCKETNNADGGTGVVHALFVDRGLLGEIEGNESEGQEEETERIQRKGNGQRERKGTGERDGIPPEKVSQQAC